jgi:hypothetical protein
MCQFFSFCTEPENHGGKRFYFDWQYRKAHLEDENDSHSLICKHFKLDEDVCNKYEFNPLTKEFKADKINSPVDDRIQAEDWVNKLDFKRVVEPLIVKPVVSSFDLPPVEIVTEEIISLLREWASVGASVWASVWDSVRDSVWDSVGASVWASVGDSVGDSVWDSVGASVWAGDWGSVLASVGDSVWDSVGDSVWAYISSFFDIQYKHDYSSAITLWNMGIVPSFDGITWRLHTGKDAHVIYEISQEKLQETS